MEVRGADQYKCSVFTYEMFGTAILVFNILVSGGEPIVGAITVFAVILVLNPVTGAHFNPSVTIGVYISRMEYRRELAFFLLMILAQFVGAAIGALLAVAALFSLDNPEGQGIIIPELTVLLCPIGIKDGAAQKNFCDTNNDRHVQAFLI